MSHATTTVTVGTLTREIDNELAPLIEALWTLGIATGGCCQGGYSDTGGRGYISFYADDFCRFLNLFDRQLDFAKHPKAGMFKQSLAGPPLLPGSPPDFGGRELFGAYLSRWPRQDGWHVSCVIWFSPEQIPALNARALELVPA